MGTSNRYVRRYNRSPDVHAFLIVKIVACITLIFCMSISELLAQQGIQSHVLGSRGSTAIDLHASEIHLTGKSKYNFHMTTLPIGESQVCELQSYDDNDSLNTDNTQYTTTNRFSIYLELYGNGLLWSINLDYKVTNNLSARVGFTHWSIDVLWDFKVTAVPIMLNYLQGKRNNWFEFGAGIAFNRIFEEGFWDEEDETHTHPYFTMILGYRYQRPKGGFLFRIGLTPVFNYGSDKSSFLSGGISFGYNF